MFNVLLKFTENCWTHFPRSPGNAIMATNGKGDCGLTPLDSLASRNQGTSLSPLSSNMLTTLTPGTSCSQGFRVRICEKPVKPELPPTLTMNYSDSQGGLSTTRAWLLNPTNFACSVPCQCTVSPYLMGKSCFSQSVVR